jgi:hypothetical protein
MAVLKAGVFMLCSCLAPTLVAAELSQITDQIKPAIGGIGSYQKTRSPAIVFIGTGFMVGGGLTVLTAAHVIEKMLENNESIGIQITQRDTTEFRGAALVAIDGEHDLARLMIAGSPLPTLSWAIRAGSAKARPWHLRASP